MFNMQVASSECSRDQPQIVFEEQLESEEECLGICEIFAPVPGCSFAAWTKGPVLGKCTLYKESFADYIGHCRQLSGPPDVSGCSVEDPKESSCDGVR